MRLEWSRIGLKLATPFRTARAVRTDKETVWVRIAHDGIEGWGESAPVETYHQTLESSEKALQAAQGHLQGHPLELERISEELLERFATQRASVAAIDAALHDWAGKRFGVSTCAWLGLSADRVPLTSYSIGLDDPDEMVRKVRAAAEFPILKLKLGTPRDEEIVTRVRAAAPKKRLRVDANCAWSVEEAMSNLPWLAACEVELVEQPLATDNLDGLRLLKEAGLCPIVADESCVTAADVPRVAQCVDGINIKLSKCGGLRAGLKMIHLARGLGLKVMLGCMVESSLGIAAAAQLAPLADWLDLDGHLLLADEPFEGIGGAGGRLQIGKGPGLGVVLKDRGGARGPQSPTTG